MHQNAGTLRRAGKEDKEVYSRETLGRISWSAISISRHEELQCGRSIQIVLGLDDEAPPRPDGTRGHERPILL